MRPVKGGDEGGFSLIEVLVAISLFAIVSIGFYSVMFAGVRGGDTTRSLVRISGEARAGFNRMVRDTREAERIDAASPTSYNVKVDFNNDGAFQNPNARGDYEDLTYSYNSADQTIRLNNSVLMSGVTPISGVPMFNYTSNILEYDWGSGNLGAALPRDGVTTWQELDLAYVRGGVTGVGNQNNVLDSAELPFISSVVYSVRVSHDGRSSNFFAEAELRNRR
jgi:prepilin-type N-terminal cleavage/methylation domain-containing protein